MAPLREDLWRPGRDLPFLVLCAALVASMIRSTDQPSVEIGVGGTDVALVPADVALAALAAFCVARLAGSASLPRPARALTAAAAAFAAWLLASSAVNGAEALVGALKLLEYGILALGVVLFVRRRLQLWGLVGLVVALTVAADVVALIGFAQDVGERQGSFLGTHDYAALGTMSLAAGVAALFARAERAWPAVAAVAAGAVAVALGAALASLLGMWLALAAIITVAAARGAVRGRAVLTTVAIGVAVTAAAIPLRSGDLGFVGAVAGEEAAAPGQFSGGWSQRLIYAYIGARVFLDQPIAGTGWHGELPPSEWAHHLDDARERFPDEPPRYFPAPDDRFIPQQTYDQVLFELGLVGALLFLALAALAVRTAVRVGRRWPRGGADEAAAYLPAAWLAALAGALAGAALFGGIPLTAMFWLTLGVVALAPSLVPPPARPAPAQPQVREQRVRTRA